MRKLIVIILILFLAIVFMGCADSFELIAELPDTDEFMTQYTIVGEYKSLEQYYDIGIVYKTISIDALDIPIISNIPIISDLSLLNYKKMWVIFTDANNSKIKDFLWGQTFLYTKVDKEELDEIAAKAGIALPSKKKLPFWTEWGGRIVLIPIVLFFILRRHYQKYSGETYKVNKTFENGNIYEGDWENNQPKQERTTISFSNLPSDKKIELLNNFNKIYKETENRINDPVKMTNKVLNDKKGMIEYMDKYYKDDPKMQMFMRDVITNYTREIFNKGITLDDFINRKSREEAFRDYLKEQGIVNN